MDQWASEVYGYLRARGGPGDEVRTEVRPWLEREHGMTHPEAARVRDKAMKDLKQSGLIERINVRGPYVRILG